MDNGENRWSNEVREQIIALSKRANILTKYTAFIGVSSAETTPTATNSSMHEAQQAMLGRQRGGGYVCDSAPSQPYYARSSRNTKAGYARMRGGGPPPPMMAGGCGPPPPMMAGGCRPPPMLSGAMPRVVMMADSPSYDYDDGGSESDEDECMGAVREQTCAKNRSDPQVASDIAKGTSHVTLVRISKIKGNWEDSNNVWSCIKSYNSTFTKELLMSVSSHSHT